MLVGLRTRADAVMIGAGTMRQERYGRVVRDPAKRERRTSEGLAADPLMVLVSGRLDLPWDARALHRGTGEVLIFTSSDADPPGRPPPRRGRPPRRAGSTSRGRSPSCARSTTSRSLLCEGGPHLHGAAAAGRAGRRAVRDPRAQARRRRGPGPRRGPRRGRAPARGGLAGLRARDRRAVRPLPRAVASRPAATGIAPCASTSRSPRRRIRRASIVPPMSAAAPSESCTLRTPSGVQ